MVAYSENLVKKIDNSPMYITTNIRTHENIIHTMFDTFFFRFPLIKKGKFENKEHSTLSLYLHSGQNEKEICFFTLFFQIQYLVNSSHA